MDVFAYDRSLVNDELARLRYETSIRLGFHESYSQMFPRHGSAGLMHSHHPMQRFR